MTFPPQSVISGPGVVVPTDEEFYVGGKSILAPTIRQDGHLWRQQAETAGWFLEHPLFGLTFERDIPADQRPWRPFVETVPWSNGQPDPAKLQGKERFFANSHYLVFTREIDPADPYDADKVTLADQPPMVHLSMRTVENDTRHDWREMQRVKTELLGPSWEGAELYPADERVVDTANQYHLWCVPFAFPFGFGRGLRLNDGEHPASLQGGATQRAFQETTTGSPIESDDEARAEHLAYVQQEAAKR